MKKKYTFEQVVRLLKKYASSNERYVFEFPEASAHPMQRITSHKSIFGEIHLHIQEKRSDGWSDDAYPYVCDGWELVRPVKVKRERVKVGSATIIGCRLIGISGLTANAADGVYDLEIVKP